jgi:hypothetical protein
VEKRNEKLDPEGAAASDWATLALHIQRAAYCGVHSGNLDIVHKRCAAQRDLPTIRGHFGRT